MFSDISSESTERLYQTTILLNQIKALETEAENSISELLKIHKGLFFISLYACIEYAVINSCVKFLSIIETQNHLPLRFKNKLLCIILNSEFNSVIDCGKKKTWEKKEGLIEKIFSNQPINIDNTVFPSDGINIGAKQLRDVWNFMHLPGDAIPQFENEWYLKEIKEHRNAIAHGRVVASEVGKRYTSADLEKRHGFIGNLCGHIIGSFDSHIKNHTFLKDSA